MAHARPVLWRAQLRHRGVVRHEGRHAAITIGDGGDLVVPGLGGVHVLAKGDRLLCVPGLELAGGTIEIADAGRVLAVDEVVILRVVAHPEIEIRIVREIPETASIARAPILPWRETVYGLTFAACVSAFITVKVAVSPARDREKEDREIARELLADVPFAYVMPPPVLEPLSGERQDFDTVAHEPAPQELATDDRDIETPEVSEVAQLEPKALPKPRKRRAREVPDSVEIGILSATGTIAMLSARDGSDAASLLDEFVDDGASKDVSVAPKNPVEGIAGGVKGGIPGGVPGGVPARIPEDSAPAEAPTKADVEGVEATSTCAMRADPKDRIDIVFVVDVSAPMPKTLWHLAQQVGGLQRRIADKHPRYGIVAFADDIEMVRLDALTPSELRTALLGLSEDAKTRDLDADVRDDVLGALDRAREFPWGDTRDTLRMIVLVTDNDYGDRGDELGEHTVGKSHARVAEELADASIRVSSITRQRVPGLDRERGGKPSIPAATAGLALRESVVYPEDGLVDALDELLDNPVCTKNLAGVLVGE